jgi:hypothetical protein
MMRKQQMASFPGKKLSRNEMKNLNGGAAYYGTWVCPSDGYSCFPNKWTCIYRCPDKVCYVADYCP